MTGSYDVLIVEDSPPISRVLERWLQQEGISAKVVETVAEAIAAVQATVPTVAVIDLGLPDGDGMDVIREIVAADVPTYPIVLTGQGSLNTAVEAMQAGARDFLVKPSNQTRFVVSVKNGLETRRLQNDVASLKDAFGENRFHGFIGSSPAMQAAYKTIKAAATSKATVFGTGESGTGKELAADALHHQSPRRSGPFIALNCGAIPRELIESEIFGHMKGAFTGATTDRDGAAKLAHKGTLFLDEICEMDLDLQVKLLRFIQTGTFQKVGGSSTEKVDVRFVCATNRDPWVEVQEGRFREDLYYRLHVIPLQLPPLRDRGGDKLEIAQHFLAQMGKEEGKPFEGFADDVAQIILSYDWPGNVRQLQNVVRNIVVLNDGKFITRDMLPPPLDRVDPTRAAPRPGAVAGPATAPAAASEADIRPLWMVEKDTIETAISLCEGNIQKAARLLDISPSTIYRKRMAWDEHAAG
jgi:DNA-binding NtrC family response regulator